MIYSGAPNIALDIVSNKMMATKGFLVKVSFWSKSWLLEGERSH
jgi:hypothetical protein